MVNFSGATDQMVIVIRRFQLKSYSRVKKPKSVEFCNPLTKLLFGNISAETGEESQGFLKRH
jgi:hypothetical protein